MFSLSNGPMSLCDDIQTGLHILIPERGQRSECTSDTTLEISWTA